MKDANGWLLTEDGKIRERWEECFCKLLNEEARRTEEEKQDRLKGLWVCKVTVEEVETELRKMKVGKSVGPDGIPVEV